METSATTAGTTTVTSYTYDKANNRATKSVSVNGGTAATTNYTLNNLNQITSMSGAVNASFGYDANGNQINETEGSATNTYSYDIENRLTTVDQSTGPASANGIYNYQYDYRTRRILRDESQAGGVKTKIIYSGGTSVQEYDNGALFPPSSTCEVPITVGEWVEYFILYAATNPAILTPTSAEISPPRATARVL